MVVQRDDVSDCGARTFRVVFFVGHSPAGQGGSAEKASATNPKRCLHLGHIGSINPFRYPCFTWRRAGENDVAKGAGKSPVSDVTDVQSKRIKALRRGFQRLAGRKLDTCTASLRDYAALCMAKAEAAAVNAHISASDFRVLDSAARRARLDYERMLAARPAPPEPTLAEYLAGVGA
jgi:hypothetical protein